MARHNGQDQEEEEALRRDAVGGDFMIRDFSLSGASKKALFPPSAVDGTIMPAQSHHVNFDTASAQAARLMGDPFRTPTKSKSLFLFSDLCQ